MEKNLNGKFPGLSSFTHRLRKGIRFKVDGIRFKTLGIACGAQDKGGSVEKIQAIGFRSKGAIYRR